MDSTKAQRKIIHIDMDAFFASVEQRDCPEYKGKPIVVGGLPEGRGGVVAAASYEARAFGVRSAMPSKIAQRLCPEAIFVRPRFEVYKEVSRQLHDIFHRYTDLVEPLSLDEAYLDVTNDKLGIGYAMEIAKQIKQAIREELNLTASAGVSVNKFIAKVASDMNKPDGITFIGPSKIKQFMERLPVDKFYGVGKVTAAKMKSIGLFTGADLKKLSEYDMHRLFGKTGKFFYNIVRGIDDRPVRPFREAKSVSVEDTYPEDLITETQMMEEFVTLVARLIQRVQRKEKKGRTVTIKLKFFDFTQITRSLSQPEPYEQKEEILAAVQNLLAQIVEKDDVRPVRLLGVGLSNFTDESNELDYEKLRTKYGFQLKLFPNL